VKSYQKRQKIKLFAGELSAHAHAKFTRFLGGAFSKLQKKGQKG